MKLQPPRRFRALVAVLLLLLACASVLLALSANAQTQSSTPTAAAPPPPQPAAQTAAQPTAQLVRLNVIVSEESPDKLVADLRQEDFRVEEGGAAQTITYLCARGVAGQLRARHRQLRLDAKRVGFSPQGGRNSRLRQQGR